MRAEGNHEIEGRGKGPSATAIDVVALAISIVDTEGERWRVERSARQEAVDGIA